MMVLAITTTGPKPAIAALRGSRLLAVWQGMFAQSALIDGLHEMLAEVGITDDVLREEVLIVAVATGPGRYARLRAGVAFAKGLAAGFGVELVGVPSAEAVASAATGHVGPVAITAGRGRFYLVDGPSAAASRGAVGAAELACMLPPAARVACDVDDRSFVELEDQGIGLARVKPVGVARAVGRLALERVSSKAKVDPVTTQPVYTEPRDHG